MLLSLLGTPTYSREASGPPGHPHLQQGGLRPSRTLTTGQRPRQEQRARLPSQTHPETAFHSILVGAQE